MKDALLLAARAATAGSAAFLIGTAFGLITHRLARQAGNPFVYRPRSGAAELIAIGAMLVIGIATLALLIAREALR